jgi:transcriptional regulator with XRE-family HTH domain
MVEEVSVRIKEIRNKLKLSQRAFAKLVGVSFVSQWKWENKKSEPHPLFLKKIEELSAEEDNRSHPSL